MAKFRFKMQSILDIKTQLESQAKIEFGRAVAKLAIEEDKLKMLRIRQEENLEEGRRLRLEAVDLMKLKENEAGRISLEDMINTQLEVIERAKEDVEEARIKMAKAMQEKKTFEKLREHAFEDFKKEISASEAKEVDELVSYTYGQKVPGV